MENRQNALISAGRKNEVGAIKRIRTILLVRNMAFDSVNIVNQTTICRKMAVNFRFDSFSIFYIYLLNNRRIKDLYQNLLNIIVIDFFDDRKRSDTHRIRECINVYDSF